MLGSFEDANLGDGGPTCEFVTDLFFFEVNLSLISNYRSVLSATEFEGSESFFSPLPDSAEDSELLQHKGEQRRVNNLTH